MLRGWVAIARGALCAAVALANGAQAAPNADPERLRAIVQAEASKVGAKGVEFGMWLGDREVLTTALGESMTTVPATTDMHYRIGGIGETFMSTLLLILVEQKRIGLDDKISRWFPHLLDADKVTVRMLVSNTAGYPDYVTNEDFVKLELAEPFRSFTDDELIDYSVRGGRMNFPPGEGQQYSHTDNVILGQVIQRATGQSIGALYQKYIFGPLDMKDTGFPADQEIQRPVFHAYSKDRGVYEDSTYWNPLWGSTPAQITSNLHDLGRWGPIFGTGRLVSPADFKTQIAPTSVGKGRNRPDIYFAYGFVVANGWLAQNPNINGYSGAFGYNLATGVTIVVEASKGETANDSDAPAFEIFRAAAKYVTPAAPIDF
ncbi:MAG TPA: serine hydrolase domain-containing protein [Caulobacteraceae bacterium]